jgi:hypothetical protein
MSSFFPERLSIESTSDIHDMAALTQIPAGRADRWKWLAAFLDEWSPTDRILRQGISPARLDSAETRLGLKQARFSDTCGVVESGEVGAQSQ